MYRRRPDRHHRGPLPPGRGRVRGPVPGARRHRLEGGPLRPLRGPREGPQRPGRPRPRRAPAPPGTTADLPRQAQAVPSRYRRPGRLRRGRATQSTTGSRRSTTSTTRRQLPPGSWTAPPLVAIGSKGGRRALRPPPRADHLRGRLRLRADHHAHRPRPATRKALAKAGLTIDDIDLVEINEAFAAVVLRFVKDMGLSWTRSTSTAAPALGHPLGATGAMILGSLIIRAGAPGQALRPRHAVRRRRHGHRHHRRAHLTSPRNRLTADLNGDETTVMTEKHHHPLGSRTTPVSSPRPGRPPPVREHHEPGVPATPSP